MYNTSRQGLKGEVLRGYDRAIYDILSLLQVIPTEDYPTAESYRKVLYKTIMNI